MASTPKKPDTQTSPGPVKGPASYFPSIEKNYGLPIDHWMKVLDNAGDRKHGELVTLLKDDHGIGHGHASALVSHFRATS